jgi:hypothetical protein
MIEMYISHFQLCRDFQFIGLQVAQINSHAIFPLVPFLPVHVGSVREIVEHWQFQFFTCEHLCLLARAHILLYMTCFATLHCWMCCAARLHLDCTCSTSYFVFKHIEHPCQNVQVITLAPPRSPESDAAAVHLTRHRVCAQETEDEASRRHLIHTDQQQR